MSFGTRMFLFFDNIRKQLLTESQLNNFSKWFFLFPSLNRQTSSTFKLFFFNSSLFFWLQLTWFRIIYFITKTYFCWYFSWLVRSGERRNEKEPGVTFKCNCKHLIIISIYSLYVLHMVIRFVKFLQCFFCLPFVRFVIFDIFRINYFFRWYELNIRRLLHD